MSAGLPVQGEEFFSGVSLLNRPGIRAQSLGNTGVVSARTAEAIFWNPANVDCNQRGHFYAAYSSLPFKMSQSALSVGFSFYPSLSAGLGVHNLSFGDVPLRSSNTAKPDGFASPQDMEAIASLSYRLLESLRAGVEFKLASEELIESDGTTAVGLGITWHQEPFILSYSTSNHSGNLWGVDVPVTHRLGAGCSFLNSRLGVFAALNRIANEQLSLGLGFEYNYDNMACLRVGYSSDNLDGGAEMKHGISVGGGWSRSGFSIDYAYDMSQLVENTHTFAISYDFSIGDVGRGKGSYGGPVANKIPIAVFAFENLTAEPNLDWVGEAIQDILSTELSNSQYFSVMPSPHPDPASANCRLFLEQHDVVYVVVGSFVQANDQYRLDANVLEPNNPVIITGLSKIGRASDLVMKLVTELAWDLDEILYHRVFPRASQAVYQSPLKSDLIELANVQVRSVLYPARVSSYSDRPLISFDLVNTSRDTLYGATVVGGLSDIIGCHLKDHQIDILPPGSTERIELVADFVPRAMLANEGYHYDELSLTISGNFPGAPIRMSKRFQVTILPRNAINWQEPNSIVAFTAPEIVSQITQLSSYSDDRLPHLKEFSRIVAACEYLRLLGIVYSQDALINYLKTEHDQVQFPRETIDRRSGDCDDLSVLFASILLGLGVDVQFALVPGHILCLANTGIHPKFADCVSHDSAMLFVQNGFIWIPIETTSLDEGFMSAWETGALHIGSNQEELLVVDVEDGLGEFGRVSPEIEVEDYQFLVSELSLSDNISSSIAQFETIVSMTDSARTDSLVSMASKSESDYCQLSYLQSKSGRHNLAVETCRRGLEIHPGNQKIENNMANSLALLGRFDEAVAIYGRISTATPEMPAPLINLGLIYATVDLRERAVEAFASCMTSKEPEDLLNQIGIVANRGAERTGDKKRVQKAPSEAELRYLLKRAAERLRDQLPPTDSSSTMDRVINRQAPETSEKLVSAGRRGLDDSQANGLFDYLLWFKE